MQFRSLARYLQDDYRGAPAWFANTFLGNLNVMIDTLNPLLQNGLDTFYNITAERQTVTVTHNTPVIVRMRKIGKPSIVRLGYADGNPGVAAISGYNTDGTISVVVYFLGTPPTGSVSALLVFEP